eukprot:6491642-Amphidinium_carterae.5
MKHNTHSDSLGGRPGTICAHVSGTALARLDKLALSIPSSVVRFADSLSDYAEYLWESGLLICSAHYSTTSQDSRVSWHTLGVCMVCGVTVDTQELPTRASPLPVLILHAFAGFTLSLHQPSLAAEQMGM